MQQYYIDELKRRYQEKKLIPFIGAGLSVPFGLKSWEQLINELKEDLVDKKFQPAVNFDIENKDYQSAIEDIKKFGDIDDQLIQEKISTDYSLRKNSIDAEINSNYPDLVKANFKIFLTTNYDRLLDDYLPGINSFGRLTEYTSNFQRLTEENDEKYLFHLHGNVSNPNNIVISTEKYNELYNNKVYNGFMKSFSSTYSFIFLGFSFDDIFIKKLIKEHKELFKGNHYLITNKESTNNINKTLLKKTYGIQVIEYDASISSHVEEIRKLLSEITADSDKNTEISSHLAYPSVGIEELLECKSDYNNSLFYKKLGIANIGEDLREVSAYFYIAAEKFIRKSNKVGLPKEFIAGILAEVFMTYKEKYAEIYKREKNSSEVLLMKVHEDLEKINIDRLVKETNKKPTASENKGFIHILADDKDKDVWWGSERL